MVFSSLSEAVKYCLTLTGSRGRQGHRGPRGYQRRARVWGDSPGAVTRWGQVTDLGMIYRCSCDTVLTRLAFTTPPPPPSPCSFAFSPMFPAWFTQCLSFTFTHHLLGWWADIYLFIYLRLKGKLCSMTISTLWDWVITADTGWTQGPPWTRHQFISGLATERGPSLESNRGPSYFITTT